MQYWKNTDTYFEYNRGNTSIMLAVWHESKHEDYQLAKNTRFSHTICSKPKNNEHLDSIKKWQNDCKARANKLEKDYEAMQPRLRNVLPRSLPKEPLPLDPIINMEESLANFEDSQLKNSYDLNMDTQKLWQEVTLKDSRLTLENQCEMIRVKLENEIKVKKEASKLNSTNTKKVKRSSNHDPLDLEGIQQKTDDIFDLNNNLTQNFPEIQAGTRLDAINEVELERVKRNPLIRLGVSVFLSFASYFIRNAIVDQYKNNKINKDAILVKYLTSSDVDGFNDLSNSILFTKLAS